MAYLIKWLIIALVLGLPGLGQAQTAPVTRQITSGTANTATSKDYSGTIVWRSPALGGKTQTLPACGPYNNGKWIQVLDGQGTAAADNITINATSGSVSGPSLPVAINVDRGGYVLTCDGAAASWLVTATAMALGTGGGTVPAHFVLLHSGGHVVLHSGGALVYHTN
jgi:hypothetical protein